MHPLLTALLCWFSAPTAKPVRALESAQAWAPKHRPSGGAGAERSGPSGVRGKARALPTLTTCLVPEFTSAFMPSPWAHSWLGAELGLTQWSPSMSCPRNVLRGWPLCRCPFNPGAGSGLRERGLTQGPPHLCCPHTGPRIPQGAPRTHPPSPSLEKGLKLSGRNGPSSGFWQDNCHSTCCAQ